MDSMDYYWLVARDSYYGFFVKPPYNWVAFHPPYCLWKKPCTS